jgi:lipopolysaccharide biosynthesis glycosyltransferase
MSALFLLLCFCFAFSLHASTGFNDVVGKNKQRQMSQGMHTNPANFVGHNKCVLAVVDIAHGLTNELVKLHSLLLSTRRHHELHFGFLVANIKEVEVMTEAIEQCFLNISYRIQVMENFPPFMLDIMRQEAKKHSWYRPGAFGRFLLPDAFPECDLFVYLDNDIFMNIDIVADMFEEVSLTRRDSISNQSVSTYVALLFETCRQSIRIRNHQFNKSHEFIHEKEVHQIAFNQYINNGVWICNASKWREDNVVADLWDAIRLAQTEPIFLSRGGEVNRRPDDQHVTFAVLGANATHLPAHLNMRKQCEMTAQSFHHHQLGVIHLAGADKKVCSAHFPPRPMALMTSVVLSLSRVCPLPPRLLRDCGDTMKELLRLNVTFLDAGAGNFTFPPATAFP